MCYLNLAIPGTCTPAQPVAYSSAYDFSNGVTSRAGYDQTGHSYSQDGAMFTFDPTAPDVPIGPSYLPTDFDQISPVTGQLVGEDTDSAWSTPQELANIQTPFEYEDVHGVPEPTSMLLLATALGGLGAARRRRTAQTLARGGAGR